MANIALSTPTPITTRRTLGAGLFATIIGSGITAGAAASVADLVPSDPDAELLSLRAELTAAVADAGHSNMIEDWSDDEMTRSANRLGDACWAIVDAPRAQTPAGLALKAAACMHQLRYSYGCAGWGGDGEEMAWNLLSELAGDAYLPVAVPDYARLSVPARAGA